jgi:hypothetical protein
MTSLGTSKASAAALNRWSFAGAMLMAAYFLITSIYISGHRLFWYDEVFTTLTTRMPDWHTIWRALVDDNGDPSPIGFFVVARTFDKLFGPSEIGIRLPSALAMVGGMLLTYDCARRLTDNLHGLIAMAVLTCSYLTYYGYEGRSYGLFFLFATWVLWAWIRNRPAIVLAALFFFGVLIHYYLVLCLIPFAAEEAYNWRPWRRPSAKLIGGVLGAFAGLALLLPQILGSRRAHAVWWTAQGGRQVLSVLTEIFPAGLFLLALTVLWLIVNERSGPVVVKAASAAERTCWFALAIPIAGFVMARLVTHAFLDRYFIGLLPGVAVGFSCLLWRRFPNTPRIAMGILLLFAGYGVAAQALAVLHSDEIKAFGPAQERTRAILAMEEQFASRGARYIVLDTYDLRFLEVRYYSKHPERYVGWSSWAPEPGVSKYYPMQRWALDEIKQHAREAVFVDPKPESLEVLQQFGIRTVVHKSDPLYIFYPE